MDELNRVSDRIVEIIESSTDKVVLGVRLGAALKTHFPTFSSTNYQCKNLRQFIKKHVPRIAEKEYTGVDVIYTVVDSPGESAEMVHSEPGSPLISLPANPTAWKAYSNPSYPLIVIANRETGEVKAAGKDEDPQNPWVVIPKLTSDAHHQIASEFVAALQGSAKAALSNDLQDPQWYVSFFGTTKRLGLARQWGFFKREHLIRQFTVALQQHGIAALPAAPKRDVQVNRSSFTKPDGKGLIASEDVKIRDLVSRLAFTLSIEELRSLRIPLGSLLDALHR